MAFHQKSVSTTDYKLYPYNHRPHVRDINHSNGSTYLRYFNPSRYGTMDIDPPGVGGKADSVAATMATSNTDPSTITFTATTTATDNARSDSPGGDYNVNTPFPSFKDYPDKKPFVNSEYVVNPNKPVVNTYPTSDRDAVLSALRNLQDKVKKLELERMAAEHNLDALTSHTEQYKEMVKGDGHRSSAARNTTATTTSKAAVLADTIPSQPPSSKPFTTSHCYSSLTSGRAFVNSHAKELDGQLSSAENRCQALEKQLEYMRKLVDTSERDRRELVEKTLKVKQQQQQQPDINYHLSRINDLERDQLRLNATQNLAETKIRELEDRVGQEKLYRKNLQGKAAELENAFKETKSNPSNHVTSSHSNPPPPASSSSQPSLPSSTDTKPTQPPKPKVKKASNNKKKRKKPSPRNHQHPTSEQGRHYRLNLAEIPFVAGKSTTASHSLGANVQKVLAMMKSHNAALCSQAPHSHSHQNGHAVGQGSLDSPVSSSGSASSVTSSTDQDLTELLNQLQDEFRQLSSEHQQLVQQLDSASDKGERLDLEQEIEVITSRMENKAQQIDTMRNHQNKYEEKKQNALKKTTTKSKRPHSANGKLTSNGGNHLSNHQHPGNSHKSTPRPHTACIKPSTTGNSAMGKASLFMLRDMKKLQTTLRRDDLVWK